MATNRMKMEEQLIHQTVVRLNAKAWGITLGLLLGIGLFLATITLVVRGGDVVGPHLGLLGIFFPGYQVTTLGALIGFVYAFLLGFGIGNLIGRVYNRMVDLGL